MAGVAVGDAAYDGLLVAVRGGRGTSRGAVDGGGRRRRRGILVVIMVVGIGRRDDGGDAGDGFADGASYDFGAGRKLERDPAL